MMWGQTVEQKEKKSRKKKKDGLGWGQTNSFCREKPISSAAMQKKMCSGLSRNKLYLPDLSFLPATETFA
jgi:hypothetical protein